MTSFADSEKRLIAALARIEQALDRGPGPQAQSDAPQPGEAAAQDSAELTRLQSENTALKRRLAETGEELARLAAANEALSQANADLTADKEHGSDPALRAEIEALKAARAAEMAALDDIMAGLEGLIAQAPRASDAPFAEDVSPASGHVVAFDQNEG
ncbi:hypothetical protein [Paracoccus sediminicola]|uniref:hypothetical protein n=1 Tax=Paracoccus sediminicola TaxID=3017783 RepID=UPI0022F05C93|nr:hypothetical protein [Paracoccus sediminicola]WBU55915.1 hypothetical protein PAF18_10430 [Paracoccus sediminicola]